MISRDELAARCLVASLGHAHYSREPDVLASDAVECADALLARLRPVAPASGAPAPLPGAPLAAPSRPEWVRITGPEGAVKVTVGKVYRVADYAAGGAPIITNDEGTTWCLPGPGETITATYPRWEPCAAPSPAATPAAWVPKAYVPKVGDKVEFDAVFTDNKSGVVVAVDEARQVASIVRFGEAPSKPKWERYFYDVRLIGVANDIERINAGLPATSSERAAAGLPVDASATKPVDREGLIAAMNKAARLWVESADKRSLAECHADAAIAFMAKGPAFDRAEFNEAQEREAAKVAVSRDAGDDFTRGWLARARVAAKGGAS